MKKFPGSLLSVRLLYVRSSTSSMGKVPKPRGRVLSLFILEAQRKENVRQTGPPKRDTRHLSGRFSMVVIGKAAP